jgi:hypothetical protein
MNLEGGPIAEMANRNHYCYKSMTAVLYRNYKCLGTKDLARILHEEVWNGLQKLNSGFGSICTLTQSNMLNMLIRSLEEKMLPRWDPVSVIDVLLDNRGKLWILTEAQIFIIDKGVKKVVFNCGKRFLQEGKIPGDQG